jgi:hypothetical protein
MSEAATLWLFGTLISVLALAIGALAGALWSHVGHCKDVSADVATLKANTDRILQEIGTHDTGLRGTVHKTANAVSAINGEIAELKRRHRGER